MKPIIKVALIALLWITVIQSGRIDTIDTILRLQMAHAWWTGTEEVAPDVQPSSWQDPSAGVIGVGGKRYITYDVGQSLLMLPGDWLGTKLHQSFPKLGLEDMRYLVVNFLIFLPLNVAAVVSCFWLLRLFNFEEQIAGLTSIVWLISTTVLHYAQVPFQNNQVLLFVTIGYAAALACIRHGRPRFALISGLALGAALLIRMTSVIHILTVFLFLVGCITYQSRDKLKVLKIVRQWIVGFIPLAFLGRFFDYIRYGSLWTTGASLAQQQFNTDPVYASLPERPANFPFTNPPHVGILGVLFSPAKSIFLYDPLLLPCLVLGIVLWKKLSPYIQLYLVICIFNLGLHLVLTSQVDFWHGDWAWGARYHVTSVHLLLIPLIALFIQRVLFTKGLTVWLMRGILTLAIIVQIASVTMPLGLEITSAQVMADKTPRYLQFRLGQRLTNIACLVNSSFSQKCINRLNPDQQLRLEEVNKVSFLPFGFSRKAASNPALVKLSPILFVLWGLVLALAIGTTLWYGLSIWASGMT
ncbi:MAG: hypothetical protein RIG63_29550 [Coleofasciculus chthonoplastes F3-SA18-01]|uniref:hypothetical protein n=1 Tax=Coleofasciculus chthonoplastes TaxID=64178 RepID=UPI0032F74770